VLPNCDDSPSKSVWVKAGWKDIAPDPEQLFDLVFDPEERCNLADRPAFKSVLDEMRKRLDDHMKRTSDPLLHGPVPAPKGAKVNDPDQSSPQEPVTTL
jgi:hypothetical protein